MAKYTFTVPSVPAFLTLLASGAIHLLLILLVASLLSIPVNVFWFVVLALWIRNVQITFS